MKVLCACEESQAVCIAFREKGHEAYSCDLEPCSGGHPEWHTQQDVLPLLNGYCEFVTVDGKWHSIHSEWDMIIAFPPCTYLSNAGACRLYPQKGKLDQARFKKGLEAKAFFMKFYNADCPRIAIENPISSTVFEMPEHTQTIQPYEYESQDDGIFHPYTKATRLWLKGLRPLTPTSPNTRPIGPYVPAGTSRKNNAKYGAAKRGEDAKNRAKTFQGIARAMAAQWGSQEAAHDE